MRPLRPFFRASPRHLLRFDKDLPPSPHATLSFRKVFRRISAGRQRKQGFDFEEGVSKAIAEWAEAGNREGAVVEMTKKWGGLLRDFTARHGGLSEGNRVEILANDAAFEDMLNAIRSAKSRVLLETYIFDNSYLGRTFAAELSSAAARGVEVAVVADWAGSVLGTRSLRNPCFDQMEAAGVRVLLFNRFWPLRPPLRSPFFRNHRKMLVADQLGYCGSRNIAGAAGGPRFGLNRLFDLQVKFSGPAVADLALVFEDSLREGRAPFQISSSPAFPPHQDGVIVQVLQSNVRRNQRSIQHALSKFVPSASHSLLIASPYFLPPLFLRRAVARASHRGTPVRVLISGRSDVPGDVPATEHIIPQIIGNGRNTRVFRFKEKHVHCKAVVIDGLWASVGSFNWDRISARRNLEVGVAVLDAKFAEQAISASESLIQNPSTEEVTLRRLAGSPYARKVWNWACHVAGKLSAGEFSFLRDEESGDP